MENKTHLVLSRRDRRMLARLKQPKQQQSKQTKRLARSCSTWGVIYIQKSYVFGLTIANTSNTEQHQVRTTKVDIRR